MQKTIMCPQQAVTRLFRYPFDSTRFVWVALYHDKDQAFGVWDFFHYGRPQFDRAVDPISFLQTYLLVEDACPETFEQAQAYAESYIAYVEPMGHDPHGLFYIATGNGERNTRRVEAVRRVDYEGAALKCFAFVPPVDIQAALQEAAQ